MVVSPLLALIWDYGSGGCMHRLCLIWCSFIAAAFLKASEVHHLLFSRVTDRAPAFSMILAISICTWWMAARSHAQRVSHHLISIYLQPSITRWMIHVISITAFYGTRIYNMPYSMVHRMHHDQWIIIHSHAPCTSIT